MPLTPRDKRTLMVGGGILAVLLVGFMVMNLLTGGGGDEAFPSLPPITVDPDPNAPGQATTSPTVGVSPIPVFTGRDPFSVPPGLTTAIVPTSGTDPTNGSTDLHRTPRPPRPRPRPDRRGTDGPGRELERRRRRQDRRAAVGLQPGR